MRPLAFKTGVFMSVGGSGCLIRPALVQTWNPDLKLKLQSNAWRVCHGQARCWRGKESAPGPQPGAARCRKAVQGGRRRPEAEAATLGLKGCLESDGTQGGVSPG